MKNFKELGLSDDLVGVLSELKIKTPSEIQEKAIPLVLAGKDVIGGSTTGSGKTLVFASSIIENLKKNGKVQALVLAPARELAEQVTESIKNFSSYKELNVLSVYGGVNIENQIRLLKNTDVVVGTPGRILDHLQRKTLDLSHVKFLVLDEVDKMFDMGFQVDVEKILKECPKNRQTMLFSATISSSIDYLAQKYTNNPVEVSVESHVDPLKLKQFYYDVSDGLKFSLFVHLLKEEKSKLVMVFCGTRRNVDFVTNNLNNLGIYAKAIHGGMLQNKRTKVMSEFNSEKGVNVLVCTDVAARGLDISGVSHVFNYDLPKTSEDYIHRIGRTARAGREGVAISVLCSRDYENFSNIRRDENIKITELPLPNIERVGIIVENRRSFGRSGGFNRGSRGNFNQGRNERSGSGRFDRRNSPKAGNFGRAQSNNRMSNSRGPQMRNDIRSGRTSSDNRRSFGADVSPRGERNFARGREDNFGRGREDIPRRGRPSTRRSDNRSQSRGSGRRDLGRKQFSRR